MIVDPKRKAKGRVKKKPKKETLEEFLIRGNDITTESYVEPQPTDPTFNGKVKFLNNRSKRGTNRCK